MSDDTVGGQRSAYMPSLAELLGESVVRETRGIRRTYVVTLIAEIVMLAFAIFAFAAVLFPPHRELAWYSATALLAVSVWALMLTYLHNRVAQRLARRASSRAGRELPAVPMVYRRPLLRWCRRNEIPWQHLQWLLSPLPSDDLTT
ncbi:MAG: metallopeptidase family protein [Microbacteriaceae bacterium]|nr:metallopeptidase family protein [Microbacteriaceae bacterium]MCL2794224.1 metallopeptidase family protein [Microbacteriaceae bacterium]